MDRGIEIVKKLQDEFFQQYGRLPLDNETFIYVNELVRQAIEISRLTSLVEAGERECEWANEEVLRLQHWVQDLQKGMFINCVYCGHRYGRNDEVPATMADVLKEHIEQCPKHPMSKLKKDNTDLTRQLAEANRKCRDCRSRQRIIKGRTFLHEKKIRNGLTEMRQAKGQGRSLFRYASRGKDVMNDQPKLFDLDHQGTFYNTTEEDEAQLEISRAQVTGQERRVLELFKYGPATPFVLWGRYSREHDSVPITSIRRAITNLTKAGYLEKTERQVVERWGKSNYIWKVKEGS